MKITQDLLLFPFHDEDWIKKAVIFGVVMFLGVFLIPLPLVSGYGLRLMRGVIKTGEPHLPDWDNLGEMYLDGLAQMVIGIVYLLPLYVLLCCGLIPFFMGPVFLSTVDDPSGWAVGGSILGYAIAMLLFGLASMFGIAVQFILYVALAHYVDTGDLGSAFKLREVWNILRANLGHFVLAYAVYWGLSAGLGFVTQILVYTIVLICILPFLTVGVAFYVQALLSTLYGLAYREAQEKLGAALSGPDADQPLPGMTGE